MSTSPNTQPHWAASQCHRWGPLLRPLDPNTSDLSPVQSASRSVHRLVTRSQYGIFKPNPKYGLLTHVAKSPIPRNPVSALNDPNWKLAIDDEYNVLITNKTWVLVPHPHNVNVIRSIWIFTHKEKSNDSFKRHKPWLVCDGKTQQVGIDCGKTFSSVVKSQLCTWC